MPSDLNYAHEKYSAAVHAMALGRGGLRERLVDAFLGSAHLAYSEHQGLGPAIDPALHERMRDFHERMTKTTAEADEGKIVATVNAMTDGELDEAAEELVAIADALDWAWRVEIR